MSNLDLSLYRSIEALADNYIPNPILRIDFFLHSVITGEECNLEPVTKTEEYLYALATGDESRLGLYGDSISLLEEYLEALRTGDTSNLREPRTREEIILYQAVTGEDLGVKPVSRIETYLSMLQNAGGLDYILSTSTNASVIPLTNSINGKARVQEMCGDTLVNCFKGFGVYKRKNDAFTVSNNTLTMVGTGSFPDIVYKDFILKPDTMYTFIVNVDELNVSSSSDWVLLRVGEGDGGINSFVTVPTNVGLHVSKFITPNTVRVVDSYCRRSFTSAHKVVLSNPIILEGDWTNREIPSEYFEGMKSCGETKDNTIDVQVSNGVNISQHTIQLPQPLRGLPNGVQDRIVYLDENTTPIAPEGKGLYLEKNVDEFIPNKIDNVHKDGLSDNVCLFRVRNNCRANCMSAISNVFKYVQGYDLQTIPFDYYVASSGNMWVAWTRTSNIENDKRDFIDYVNNNNVKVCYALQTPTYTKISDVNFECYENATVYVDSGAIAPTKTVIRYPYKQPALFSL